MSTTRVNEVRMLDDIGKANFTFDSVQDLKDSTQLKIGQKVRTLGYYTLGDGGGNDYEIVAAGTGADDGGSFIDLVGSGLQAKGLFLDGIKNIDQFGAVPGYTDDITAHLQAALYSSDIVGQTTDDPPVVYRNDIITVPDKTYTVKGPVIIPNGVSLVGKSQKTDYNQGGDLANVTFGSAFFIPENPANVVFSFEGKILRGTASTIENIKFFQGQSLRGQGPHGTAILDVSNTFMLNIVNCDFFELGFNNAIHSPSQSNGTVVKDCNFIKIGNANNQQVMPPPSTFYTYGNGINFGEASISADSKILDCFVESCGGTGISLSGNNKVSNCFVDLCANGVVVNGNRCQITGSSIKWNQTHGIVIKQNSNGLIIDGNVVQGNNYKSAITLLDDVGYAIDFQGSSKYVTISNNNMVDDYESIIGHNLYKTVRQAGIDLRNATAATAIITGNWFSDPDPQWESNISDNYPLQENAALVINGKVLINTCMIESAGPVNLRSYPFTVALGSTLGSVTKRIAYRDKDGNVVGQIPLYDVIS